MAMGIYVGAGGVKTVSSIYVGAGGVKTVKEVYVGAGGVKKVWPAGTYLFDGDMSNWQVVSLSTGSSKYYLGYVENNVLQISNSYSYQDTYSGAGRSSFNQYVQFYNTSIEFMSLDDYSYICFDYHPGTPDNESSTYSQYLSWGYSFRWASSATTRYTIRGGNTKITTGGTGTIKCEITDSMKSTYRSALNGSSYYADRFNVGGWNSDRVTSSGGGDDEEYTYVYYTLGYISAIWFEE